MSSKSQNGKSLMKKIGCLAFIIGSVIAGADNCRADNPLIQDQFTADPTARVFEGKMYLYPSHDIPAPEDFARKDWFCMADYHVFSSDDLINWTDHGVIVSQDKVEWVNPTSYSMWAPDCVYKDGKYYFYFPATGQGRGMSIGVAISDKPYGPFKPEPKPIQGVNGIDPCVLIDDDGSSYIYYSMGNIFVAKLKDNMLELDSETKRIDLPKKGLIEGPFTFKRNGIYYLTYPHVENKTERIEYAISDNPMGPFEHKGVIIDENASGCWTIHHSILEYKGQWYIFYHDQDLSPEFDKNRAAKADKLSFNADGTIQKVIPTVRGIGVADAKNQIQVDRYSALSDSGAEVVFNVPDKTFQGWKTVLTEDGAWVRYNRVAFDNGSLSKVKAKASSVRGSTIEIRSNSVDGELLASVKIPAGQNWSYPVAELAQKPTGQHDLVIILKGTTPTEIDWIQFE